MLVTAQSFFHKESEFHVYAHETEAGINKSLPHRIIPSFRVTKRILDSRPPPHAVFLKCPSNGVWLEA